MSLIIRRTALWLREKEWIHVGQITHRQIIHPLAASGFFFLTTLSALIPKRSSVGLVGVVLRLLLACLVLSLRHLMGLKVVWLLRHLIEFEGCAACNTVSRHLILLALVQKIPSFDDYLRLREDLSLLNCFL